MVRLNKVWYNLLNDIYWPFVIVSIPKSIIQSHLLVVKCSLYTCVLYIRLYTSCPYIYILFFVSIYLRRNVFQHQYFDNSCVSYDGVNTLKHSKYMSYVMCLLDITFITTINIIRIGRDIVCLLCYPEENKFGKH